RPPAHRDPPSSPTRRSSDLVPVPERYFEAAARLDTHPDGGPPEFWLGRGATERVAHWLVEHGLANAKLAALAPGAAHATKRWPVDRKSTRPNSSHQINCYPV